MVVNFVKKSYPTKQIIRLSIVDSKYKLDVTKLVFSLTTFEYSPHKFSQS